MGKLNIGGNLANGNTQNDLTLNGSKENRSVPITNELRENTSAQTVSPNGKTDTSLKNERINDLNNYGNFLKNKITSAANQDVTNLEERADKLNTILSRGGFSSYDEISPYISGLSDADTAKLKSVYQQKTGRSLVMDISNWLPMEDKFRAFSLIATERIIPQDKPQETGYGINMNPPATEVPLGSEVKYSLNIGDQIGEREVFHLIQGENAKIAEKGDSFTGTFPTEERRLVLFEVRHKGQPSTFYAYRQNVVNANDKADYELSKLPGTSPDTELYQQYLDLRLNDGRELLSQLEAKKTSLENELQTGPTRTTDGSRNSSDVYTELRQVTQQIEQVKAGLAELETSKTELTKAFGDAVEKPIPLQAVLVARENGQTIPLQLYAKNLGGGKWAIVDATNPAKPRTYTGEGMIANDALNNAWKNFVGSTNNLPAGQIAVAKPKGLGLTNENTPWNAASNGQSLTKWAADGIGKGSLILAGAGVVALFVPGGQPIGVGLLLGSGVGGGISSGLNLADRINNGTFELKSSETALDMLGIVGGLASAGGIASITNAGSKGLSLLTNSGKFNLQKYGNFTKISQIAEQGTNVAGGILISNQYLMAMDEVQKSNISPEQKTSRIREIFTMAIATGGVMILGVGIARKYNPPTDAKLNSMLKQADLSPELQNLVKTDLRVQKVFVNNGKEKLTEIYEDFLRGGVKGEGLKVKDFGVYLGNRKLSTSLDKSTDSVAETFGKENFSRMNNEQVNRRILEMTNPNLAQNYKNLPKRLRDSIDATLKTNHNLSADIQFKTATEKFNKKLYEGIGKEIQNLAEFRQALALTSNPSANGSIGNGYAQRNLIDGETIKEFGFSPELWTGVNSTNRRADNLLITGRTTLDIKTGYAKGYPNGDEVKQLLDYNNLVRESQNPARVKLREYLEKAGVKGGELKYHDYLFLTNGTTNTKDVAITSFSKINNQIRLSLPTGENNIRVFYQDKDGKIYQIVKVLPKRNAVVKLIGDKLPN